MATCPTCKGEGAPKCPQCDGKGRTGGGIFSNQKVCDHCGGSGKAPTKCSNCNGTGKI